MINDLIGSTASSHGTATPLYYAHVAVLLCGLFYSAVVAAKAFGRRVTFEDLPTFPRYMTRRSQYLAGLSCFTFVSMLIFFLLVYLNKEVTPVISLFDQDLYARVKQAIDVESPSYLFAVVLIAIFFIGLLHWENEFNPIVVFRNTIQIWIRIPYLVQRLAYLTKNTLSVPDAAVSAVINSADITGVYKDDFTKHPQTIDRKWAEISYIKWWLENRNHDEDATFFGEDSFNWNDLVKEYVECAKAVGAARSEESTGNEQARGILKDLASQRLESLYAKFARLVACYLVYKNASFESLRASASEFGIQPFQPSTDNPLSYSIIYIVTLLAAVYVGVYSSAILYDLIQGFGLVQALGNQDPDLVLRWIVYTAANYGAPIVLILLLRTFLSHLHLRSPASYLQRYCWVFLFGLLVGPFWLSVAVEIFGTSQRPFLDLYFHHDLVWGIGPGLICVYLYYFLDRQTQSDLPDVQTQHSIWPKLMNSATFTCVVVLILLPRLMGIIATQSVWDNSKVRFVATGATFLVTLSLALVAQFGLRKLSGAVQIIPPARPSGAGLSAR